MATHSYNTELPGSQPLHVAGGFFYGRTRLTISKVWQFFRELLASATLTGIVGRFTYGVMPPPLFMLLPTLLFSPFIARDFALMEPELISAYGDIMMGIGAIIVGVVGAIGVNTWRAQLIGEKEYNLSLEIQDKLFDLQNAVQDMRQEFLEQATLDRALAATTNANNSLYSAVKKGRAHWGLEIIRFFVPLNTMTISAQHQCDLAHAARMTGADPKRAQTSQAVDEAFKVAYKAKDESDEFSRSFLEAVTEFEEFLKQHIKK